MVLQRLAGFLGRWVRTVCVATAEGQFINCQTPSSMRELRLGRDRGELARATRLWSGGSLAGVQRGTMGIIFYFARFGSPFLALPSSPPAAHSFMPIRPSTRAHPYKDTWRSVDWDASGEAIIAPVTRPYESCLNESTRERSVDTRTFSTRYSYHIVSRFNDTVAADEQLSARINYAKDTRRHFSLYIFSIYRYNKYIINQSEKETKISWK